MEDILDWKESSQDRAQAGSLNNVVLLRIYLFCEGTAGKVGWIATVEASEQESGIEVVIVCQCFSVFYVSWAVGLTAIMSHFLRDTSCL